MRWMAFGLWAATLPMAALPPEAQTSSLPEAPAPAAAAALDAAPAVAVHDPRWDTVLNLRTGEAVEVRERATGLRSDCVVEFVNDTVLACGFSQRYGPYRRVLYPHTALDRVWVTREVHGASGKALLIGAGVGAVLGGVLFRGGGASAVSLGSLGGAALGGVVVAASDPLGLRMHTQRLLIYRAP
jgi:hypothetical protein